MANSPSLADLVAAGASESEAAMLASALASPPGTPDQVRRWVEPAPCRAWVERRLPRTPTSQTPQVAESNHRSVGPIKHTSKAATLKSLQHGVKSTVASD